MTLHGEYIMGEVEKAVSLKWMIVHRGPVIEIVTRMI